MRLAALAGALLLAFQDAPAPDRDRSPCDVAISADGRWALTANAASDSVSLVDLSDGTVAAEAAVGKGPCSVALTPDGRRAVVTNRASKSVSVLGVGVGALSVHQTVVVGHEPRGIAIDGARAFIVLSGEDAVVALDLESLKVTARIEVGVEPWHAALAPDGKRLAVGNALSQDVSVVDTEAMRVERTVKVRGRNLRRVAVSPDGEWAYVPTVAERGLGTTRDNIDKGWVIANRLARVRLTKAATREAIALDVRGQAVADLEAVAMSADGQSLAVAAGGTHELLLMRGPLPFVGHGGPGDHIERALLEDAKRFRRVTLGGRPVSARFSPDGKSVVVANALLNAVQVVDVETGKVARTIALGGPAQPSRERRGEAIFYDGTRSFRQWYSCHSCHAEGHTNGGAYDTFGDGRYGNPKKTPSLRGVTKTGPWTWHGSQRDLRESIRATFKTTMQGAEPSGEDLDAVVAFLATVDFAPPRDEAVTEGARRGKALFRAKGCQDCHAAPHFTSELVAEVGLESKDDAHKGFNPPALRGVGRRGPWLHDGRARTLEEVLRTHHAPSRANGEKDLTEEELRDVVEYLKTL